MFSKDKYEAEEFYNEVMGSSHDEVINLVDQLPCSEILKANLSSSLSMEYNSSIKMINKDVLPFVHIEKSVKKMNSCKNSGELSGGGLANKNVIESNILRSYLTKNSQYNVNDDLHKNANKHEIQLGGELSEHIDNIFNERIPIKIYYKSYPPKIGQRVYPSRNAPIYLWNESNYGNGTVVSISNPKKPIVCWDNGNKKCNILHYEHLCLDTYENNFDLFGGGMSDDSDFSDTDSEDDSQEGGFSDVYYDNEEKLDIMAQYKDTEDLENIQHSTAEIKLCKGFKHHMKEHEIKIIEGRRLNILRGQKVKRSIIGNIECIKSKKCKLNFEYMHGEVTHVNTIDISELRDRKIELEKEAKEIMDPKTSGTLKEFLTNIRIKEAPSAKDRIARKKAIQDSIQKKLKFYGLKSTEIKDTEEALKKQFYNAWNEGGIALQNFKKLESIEKELEEISSKESVDAKDELKKVKVRWVDGFEEELEIDKLMIVDDSNKYTVGKSKILPFVGMDVLISSRVNEYTTNYVKYEEGEEGKEVYVPKGKSYRAQNMIKNYMNRKGIIAALDDKIMLVKWEGEDELVPVPCGYNSEGIEEYYLDIDIGTIKSKGVKHRNLNVILEEEKYEELNLKSNEMWVCSRCGFNENTFNQLECRMCSNENIEIVQSSFEEWRENNEMLSKTVEKSCSLLTKPLFFMIEKILKSDMEWKNDLEPGKELPEEVEEQLKYLKLEYSADNIIRLLWRRKVHAQKLFKDTLENIKKLISNLFSKVQYYLSFLGPSLSTVSKQSNYFISNLWYNEPWLHDKQRLQRVIRGINKEYKGCNKNIDDKSSRLDCKFGLKDNKELLEIMSYSNEYISDLLTDSIYFTPWTMSYNLKKSLYASITTTLSTTYRKLKSALTFASKSLSNILSKPELNDNEEILVKIIKWIEKKNAQDKKLLINYINKLKKLLQTLNIGIRKNKDGTKKDMDSNWYSLAAVQTFIYIIYRARSNIGKIENELKEEDIHAEICNNMDLDKDNICLQLLKSSEGDEYKKLEKFKPIIYSIGESIIQKKNLMDKANNVSQDCDDCSFWLKRSDNASKWDELKYEIEVEKNTLTEGNIQNKDNILDIISFDVNDMGVNKIVVKDYDIVTYYQDKGPEEKIPYYKLYREETDKPLIIYGKDEEKLGSEFVDEGKSNEEIIKNYLTSKPEFGNIVNTVNNPYICWVDENDYNEDTGDVFTTQKCTNKQNIVIDNINFEFTSEYIPTNNELREKLLPTEEEKAELASYLEDNLKILQEKLEKEITYDLGKPLVKKKKWSQGDIRQYTNHIIQKIGEIRKKQREVESKQIEIESKKKKRGFLGLFGGGAQFGDYLFRKIMYIFKSRCDKITFEGYYPGTKENLNSITDKYKLLYRGKTLVRSHLSDTEVKEILQEKLEKGIHQNAAIFASEKLHLPLLAEAIENRKVLPQEDVKSWMELWKEWSRKQDELSDTCSNADYYASKLGTTHNEYDKAFYETFVLLDYLCKVGKTKYGDKSLGADELLWRWSVAVNNEAVKNIDEKVTNELQQRGGSRIKPSLYFDLDENANIYSVCYSGDSEISHTSEDDNIQNIHNKLKRKIGGGEKISEYVRRCKTQDSVDGDKCEAGICPDKYSYRISAQSCLLCDENSECGNDLKECGEGKYCQNCQCMTIPTPSIKEKTNKFINLISDSLKSMLDGIPAPIKKVIMAGIRGLTWLAYMLWYAITKGVGFVYKLILKIFSSHPILMRIAPAVFENINSLICSYAYEGLDKIWDFTLGRLGRTRKERLEGIQEKKMVLDNLKNNLNTNIRFIKTLYNRTYHGWMMPPMLSKDVQINNMSISTLRNEPELSVRRIFAGMIPSPYEYADKFLQSKKFSLNTFSGMANKQLERFIPKDNNIAVFNEFLVKCEINKDKPEVEKLKTEITWPYIGKISDRKELNLHFKSEFGGDKNIKGQAIFLDILSKMKSGDLNNIDLIKPLNSRPRFKLIYKEDSVFNRSDLYAKKIKYKFGDDPKFYSDSLSEPSVEVTLKRIWEKLMNIMKYETMVIIQDQEDSVKKDKFQLKGISGYEAKEKTMEEHIKSIRKKIDEDESKDTSIRKCLTDWDECMIPSGNTITLKSAFYFKYHPGFKEENAFDKFKEKEYESYLFWYDLGRKRLDKNELLRRPGYQKWARETLKNCIENLSKLNRKNFGKSDNNEKINIFKKFYLVYYWAEELNCFSKDDDHCKIKTKNYFGFGNTIYDNFKDNLDEIFEVCNKETKKESNPPTLENFENLLKIISKTKDGMNLDVFRVDIDKITISKNYIEKKWDNKEFQGKITESHYFTYKECELQKEIWKMDTANFDSRIKGLSYINSSNEFDNQNKLKVSVNKGNYEKQPMYNVEVLMSQNEIDFNDIVEEDQILYKLTEVKKIEDKIRDKYTGIRKLYNIEEIKDNDFFNTELLIGPPKKLGYLGEVDINQSKFALIHGENNYQLIHLRVDTGELQESVQVLAEPDSSLSDIASKVRMDIKELISEEKKLSQEEAWKKDQEKREQRISGLSESEVKWNKNINEVKDIFKENLKISGLKIDCVENVMSIRHKQNPGKINILHMFEDLPGSKLFKHYVKETPLRGPLGLGGIYGGVMKKYYSARKGNSRGYFIILPKRKPEQGLVSSASGVVGTTLNTVENIIGQGTDALSNTLGSLLKDVSYEVKEIAGNTVDLATALVKLDVGGAAYASIKLTYQDKTAQYRIVYNAANTFISSTVGVAVSTAAKGVKKVILHPGETKSYIHGSSLYKSLVSGIGLHEKAAIDYDMIEYCVNEGILEKITQNNLPIIACDNCYANGQRIYISKSANKGNPPSGKVPHLASWKEEGDGKWKILNAVFINEDGQASSQNEVYISPLHGSAVYGKELKIRENTTYYIVENSWDGLNESIITLQSNEKGELSAKNEVNLLPSFFTTIKKGEEGKVSFVEGKKVWIKEVEKVEIDDKQTMLWANSLYPPNGEESDLEGYWIHENFTDGCEDINAVKKKIVINYDRENDEEMIQLSRYIMEKTDEKKQAYVGMKSYMQQIKWDKYWFSGTDIAIGSLESQLKSDAMSLNPKTVEIVLSDLKIDSEGKVTKEDYRALSNKKDKDIENDVRKKLIELHVEAQSSKQQKEEETGGMKKKKIQDMDDALYKIRYKYAEQCQIWGCKGFPERRDSEPDVSYELRIGEFIKDKLVKEEIEYRGKSPILYEEGQDSSVQKWDKYLQDLVRVIDEEKQNPNSEIRFTKEQQKECDILVESGGYFGIPTFYEYIANNKCMKVDGKEEKQIYPVHSNGFLINEKHKQELADSLEKMGIISAGVADYAIHGLLDIGLIQLHAASAVAGSIAYLTDCDENCKKQREKHLNKLDGESSNKERAYIVRAYYYARAGISRLKNYILDSANAVAKWGKNIVDTLTKGLHDVVDWVLAGISKMFTGALKAVTGYSSWKELFQKKILPIIMNVQQWWTTICENPLNPFLKKLSGGISNGIFKTLNVHSMVMLGLKDTMTGVMSKQAGLAAKKAIELPTGVLGGLPLVSVAGGQAISNTGKVFGEQAQLVAENAVSKMVYWNEFIDDYATICRLVTDPCSLVILGLGGKLSDKQVTEICKNIKEYLENWYTNNRLKGKDQLKRIKVKALKKIGIEGLTDRQFDDLVFDLKERWSDCPENCNEELKRPKEYEKWKAENNEKAILEAAIEVVNKKLKEDEKMKKAVKEYQKHQKIIKEASKLAKSAEKLANKLGEEDREKKTGGKFKGVLSSIKRGGGNYTYKSRKKNYNLEFKENKGTKKQTKKNVNRKMQKKTLKKILSKLLEEL